MDEIIQKRCDDYIAEVKVFYSNPDHKIKMVGLIDLSKPEIQSYLKERFEVANFLDCFPSQILHESLKSDKTHHIFRHILAYHKLYDIPLQVKDSEERTILMKFIDTYIPLVDKSEKTLHWHNFINLLERGYQAQEEDCQYSIDIYPKMKDNYKLAEKWLTLRVFTLGHQEKYKIVNENKKLAYIISLKKGKNFGLGFQKLIQSMNQVFTTQKEIGNLVLCAIKTYQREEQLKQEDTKKTFERLKQEFLENLPEQDIEFTNLVIDLLPELAHCKID